MRAGLTHDTYLDAFKITKEKQNFRDTLLTEETMAKVNELKASVDEH